MSAKTLFRWCTIVSYIIAGIASESVLYTEVSFIQSVLYQRFQSMFLFGSPFDYTRPLPVECLLILAPWLACEVLQTVPYIKG